MNYIDELIENCHTAKKAKPVRKFEMSELSELEGIQQAIYIIEQTSGDPEKTFGLLKEYKSKKERACPKLNTPSQVMYVGSTTTGLKKRIAQHIGEGHKNTYSLHLKHWFNDNYKITIKEYDLSKEVLQIIEDALSEELKPAFGKSGSNNK